MVEDVVAALVVAVERFIVGDAVGALVGTAEGLMDGALVKVLIYALETTARSS